MINILFLEDNHCLIRHIEKIFKEYQENKRVSFNIIECNNIYSANDMLEKLTKIDIIVTDLSMSPEGLAINLIEETHGGFLTGWVWLHTYVLSKGKFDNTNIIIWSGYSDLFNCKICSEADLNRKYGKYGRVIKIISKRSISDLKKALNDLICEVR